MSKWQRIKKQALRQTPKVVALTGAAVTGALLMSRYHNNNNAHFISVNTGILAVLRNEGGGFLFETLKHGDFVLAPVVKK